MNTNKITAGTIARTICLLLALVNQVLAMFGWSPIPVEDETVTMLISTGATIITALVGWWKNNSVTQAAITADKTMRQLKEGGNAD